MYTGTVVRAGIVLQPMRRNLCDAIYAMQSMWRSLCGAIYVVFDALFLGPRGPAKAALGSCWDPGGSLRPLLGSGGPI